MLKGNRNWKQERFCILNAKIKIKITVFEKVVIKQFLLYESTLKIIHKIYFIDFEIDL